jgi:hypothetical protein
MASVCLARPSVALIKKQGVSFPHTQVMGLIMCLSANTGYGLDVDALNKGVTRLLDRNSSLAITMQWGFRTLFG